MKEEYELINITPPTIDLTLYLSTWVYKTAIQSAFRHWRYHNLLYYVHEDNNLPLYIARSEQIANKFAFNKAAEHARQHSDSLTNITIEKHNEPQNSCVYYTVKGYTTNYIRNTERTVYTVYLRKTRSTNL